MAVTEEAPSHRADVSKKGNAHSNLGGYKAFPDTRPTQREHGTPHPFSAVAPEANDSLEPQDRIWQEALKQTNSL